MLKSDHSFDDTDPTAPACRATVAEIQRALDGDASPESLDADPHLGACASCRERVRAARVLLSVLATPEPVAVPAGFTDRVLSAVRDDRQAHARRRRVAPVAGVLALAAAVLVGAWVIANANGPKPIEQPKELVQQSAPAPLEVAPEPRVKAPAPEPRPINIGNEFAKAERALRDAPKPLTDSVAFAPKLLDVFTGPFTKPAAPPMGDALEPARKSIADLPDAARTGLEPVTGTAQKALDRLLRDVTAMKPKS